jgi:hypothetical protein
MDRFKGKLADPEFRKKRATDAANARKSPDYYIAKLVDAAPELTAEQRVRLAALVQPAGGERAA